MASPKASSLLSLVVVVLLFLSTSSSAASATCSTKSFSNDRSFVSCADLSALDSSLHWTYNQANATLSLAFSATPSKPSGWVAWGINPNKPAMIGTRALLAYNLPNGSVIAQTFNISAYDIHPSPIDYPVSGFSAESHSGGIIIFATLGLPKGTTTINQVWQVGPGINGSIPLKHDFQPQNLQAVGVLDLLKTSGSASAPATAPAPSGSSSSTSPGSAPSGSSSSTSPGSAPSSAGRAVSCRPVLLLALLGLCLCHHVLH